MTSLKKKNLELFAHGRYFVKSNENTKSKHSTGKEAEATCDAARVVKDWKQSLIDYRQMDKEIFKALQTAWKNDDLQSQADCWDQRIFMDKEFTVAAFVFT